MADPLHSNDIQDLDTRSSTPAGLGFEESSATNITYHPPIEDPIRKGELRLDRELPPGKPPRLNRTAEQIGGAVGRVVSQARRVPDSARKGLHVVRDRAQEVGGGAAEHISNSASSLAGNAQQRAREFTEVAERRGREFAGVAQQRARELMDVAEERGRVLLDKMDVLAQNAGQRANELKQQLDERTRELRSDVRIRAEQARLRSQRVVREHPLELLGCIAGTAFLLGISLRIVRSRNASRY